MLDTENVRDFEDGIAALLDALDKLRALPAPTEKDGLLGLVKWHDEVKKILSMSPELPDSEALTQFAEDVDRTLADVEGKARGAQAGASEKAHPRDDGLLSTPQHFWAEIVTDATGGAYTFEEEALTDGTTWTTLTGGRTGTCYEANDVAGIAVGTIIKIRVEYDTTGELRYVFDSAIPAIEATGIAEAIVIRFAIWNNATVVLSNSDWRARPIEYAAYYLDSEHELADAHPAAWSNLLANSPLNWFIGADPQNGDEYDIFDVALVGAASARMYIDDADGGKLKFECYGFAGPLHLNMVLVVKGFTRKTAADAVQVGEP